VPGARQQSLAAEAPSHILPQTQAHRHKEPSLQLRKLLLQSDSWAKMPPSPNFAYYQQASVGQIKQICSCRLIHNSMSACMQVEGVISARVPQCMPNQVPLTVIESHRRPQESIRHLNLLALPLDVRVKFANSFRDDLKVIHDEIG
jgi:hypothetical protein